jgi:hypothetical protein
MARHEEATDRYEGDEDDGPQPACPLDIISYVMITMGTSHMDELAGAIAEALEAAGVTGAELRSAAVSRVLKALSGFDEIATD